MDSPPRWLLNLYPPFLGAGIRIRSRSEAWDELVVEMDLHWWNRNYVGTHYGGSLYSMCDPFFMIMLINRLGDGFIVWDKSASIRFKKPGRGKVRARFEITDEQVEGIRTEATKAGKAQADFVVDVKDEQGEVVAIVEKGVHVRVDPREKAGPG